MHEFPESIKAQVAFLNDEWRHRADLPRIYSRETRQANTSRREVTIYNARPRHEAGELHLDDNGFVLATQPTSFTDFGNKEAVRQHYFPEMRRLVLELTQAAEAFPFPFYQVRSRSPEHFFDAYALYLHCDFSPASWSRFAQNIIKLSGTQEKYPARDWDFALYNLWRPVGNEVQKDPLTLVDASTVDRADIVDYLTDKEGDKAGAALPLFNPAQRFYYVPAMQTDEVLVFKQLDSRPGKALVCPHTSFVDPTAAADALERKSIDVRMMCAFRKAG